MRNELEAEAEKLEAEPKKSNLDVVTIVVFMGEKPFFVPLSFIFNKLHHYHQKRSAQTDKPRVSLSRNSILSIYGLFCPFAFSFILSSSKTPSNGVRGTVAF